MRVAEGVDALDGEEGERRGGAVVDDECRWEDACCAPSLLLFPGSQCYE